MKKSEANLCKRCVDILSPYFTINPKDKATGVCPWCERNNSDTIYTLSVHLDGESDNINVLTRK